MPKTTYLKLNSYNTSSCIVGVKIYEFINATSGSLPPNGNMGIIDWFSGSVSGSSGSITGISTSATRLSASVVYATTTEINTASASMTFVSPSNFSSSIFGETVCVIPINASASLMGGEFGYVEIPSKINKWYLVDAQASCAGSSTSGSILILVEQYSPAVSIARDAPIANMMTSNIIIDQGTYDSSVSITPSVVNRLRNNVSTGNLVKATIITSGNLVTYTQVSLTFKQNNV